MEPHIPRTEDREAPTDGEGEKPVQGRSHWVLSLVVILLCIAAAASGWTATRWFVDDPPAASAHPDAVSPAPTAEALPEDPQAYVAAAAHRVDSASAFKLTFTIQNSATIPLPTAGVPEPPEGPDVFDRLPTALTHLAGGWGRAEYNAEQSPSFEHHFTSMTGTAVYRYDLDDGRFAMSTSTPGGGLTVLNQPGTADRYLSSPRFASANLHEVIGTSADLTLVGQEKVGLRWPELRSTHTAYHYTGTFTAMLGGYDPRTGANTLTTVQNAEFDLWIDTEGYPRKFVYEGLDGVGATYEYHSFG